MPVRLPKSTSDALNSTDTSVGRKPSAFRRDIEGLRGIAVVLVVAYHAGIPFIGGGYVGVDVFFVISGFLITRQLVAEWDDTGRIRFARFYGRRAMRLLPASALVVLVTLAASWLWLPPGRFPSIVADVLSTAYYGMNVRLALLGTDYLHAASAPSPLQHFWSLAVEEQFYLGWPLLLVLLLTVGRRTGGARAVVPIGLSVLVVASFVFGVWLTGRSAPWAYFGLATRAWELGAGALLGLTPSLLARVPAAARLAARWAGIALIVGSAVLFTQGTAFPGYLAAVPVLGAVLIIGAGGDASPGRPDVPLRLLCSSALQAAGQVSYAWYLWHWPVLVIVPVALDMEPTLVQRLLLAGWSLLLAAVTYALVEDPARRFGPWRARPWRTIAFGAALTGVVAASAVLAGQIGPKGVGSGTAADPGQLAAQERGSLDERYSKVLKAATRSRPVPINLRPSLVTAATDLPVMYDAGCNAGFDELRPPKLCAYGDTNSSTTVVLLGDSHAAQWFPALDQVAKERRWKLVPVTKSACSVASTFIYLPAIKRPYRECVSWRKAALDAVRQLRPAMVVMSSNGGGGLPIGATGDADEVWVAAWLESIRAVTMPATRLVLLLDTPWPQNDVQTCLSSHASDVSDCARPTSRAVSMPRRREMLAAAARSAGVDIVDPLPWFCTEDTCPAVVGNTLVYRDASHITTTYASAVAPLLSARLPMPTTARPDAPARPDAETKPTTPGPRRQR